MSKLLHAKRSRFAVAPKIERTVDGITFDSKREAGRYVQLRFLERLGHIRELKLQPSWKVDIGGKPFCKFTADFSYLDQEGRENIEDTKSTGTAKDAAYRLRKKAAELYYGITVTEIIR